MRKSSPLPALVTSAAVALAALTTGCGSGPLAVLGIGKTKTAPVRPAANQAVNPKQQVLFPPPFALASKDDAVVRVIGPKMTCSGTLVDDDLVLTAHHCVVERGPHGEFTKSTLAPRTIGIELGGDYLPWGSVGVKAVVAPPCGHGGGAGDMAILVLSRKLVGLATMAPRLDHTPEIGEELTIGGFGRCAMSPDGIHRQLRGDRYGNGFKVRALTGETIEMTASVCPGDSGGPVLSRRTNEVVGVISLSAMDGDEHTANLSVFARIDSYRKVFAQARAIADGTSASELPPLECE